MEEVQGFIESHDKNSRMHQWEGIKRSAKRLSTQDKIVSKDSKNGGLILNHIKTDPQAAAGLLMLSLGLSFDLNRRPEELITLIMGVCLKSLATHEIEQQKKSLANLKRTWTDHFKGLGQDISENITSYDESRKKAENLYAKIITKAYRDKKNHVDNMKAIEDAYKTKISLRASEEYWGQVQKEKTESATNSMSLFALLVVIGIPALITYFIWAPGKWTALPWDQWQTQLFLFGLPVVGLLWAIRMTGLRYFENVGLADDARTRIAMLSAFVALESEEKVSADERLVILEALFRPRATAGGGETIPHPMMALAYRILHQRSGTGSDGS